MSATNQWVLAVLTPPVAHCAAEQTKPPIARRAASAAGASRWRGVGLSVVLRDLRLESAEHERPGVFPRLLHAGPSALVQRARPASPAERQLVGGSLFRAAERREGAGIAYDGGGAGNHECTSRSAQPASSKANDNRPCVIFFPALKGEPLSHGRRLPKREKSSLLGPITLFQLPGRYSALISSAGSLRRRVSSKFSLSAR